MFTRTVGAAALGAVLSAALLAGCSAGPSTAPLQQLNQAQGGFAQAQERALMVPQIALPSIQRQLRLFTARAITPARPGSRFGTWMYTAGLYGNDLTIYQRNGGTLSFYEKLTASISQPGGTVATPHGWWYVTNGGQSNVLIYKSSINGPIGPEDALDDAGQVPVNVAAIPSRRLVAVSNYSTTSGGAGSVSVYLNRLAIPSRTLTYGSDLVQGIGIAIDHQGNCYWSFNDPSTGGGSIVEFAGCNGSGTLAIGGLKVAGGLIFDQSDDLYYIDQTVGIYKCKGTANCQPFVTTIADPVNLNFDHKQKLIWVADATGYIDSVDPKRGTVTQYPAEGGASDPPFGIAPAPGGG